MEKIFYAGSASQEKLLESINAWFSENRSITVKKFYTDQKTKGGLLVNKSVLTSLTLIYEPNENVEHLYGIAYFEKFSLVKIGFESLKAEWAKKNPCFEAVSSVYYHHARGKAGNLLLHGLGASNRNQLWVIYKARGGTTSMQPLVGATTAVSAAPVESRVAEPIAQKKFCTACGQKLVAGSKFCMSCGQKIDP